MTDPAGRPQTLGERLALFAEQLRLRHVATFSWEPGFAQVLQRLDALDQSWAQRFERWDGAGEWTEPGGRFPSERPTAREDSERATAGRTATAAGTTAASAAARADAVAAGVGPQTAAWPADVVPVDVRARLREIAGAGADGMRVQIDAEADADARSHRADAVTSGTTVKMRSGRFRPDTPEGLGLLAHEATHVTALLARGAAAPLNTPGGVAAEEAAAARAELVAQRLPEAAGVELPRRHSDPPPSNDLPAAGYFNSATRASTTPMAVTPMRADADRPEASPTAGGFDSEGLRLRIIEDLMHRLRTDSERGG
ncbi:DUF4157 domain-containing protein [Kribbella sp. NBC_00889]|uniref:eCIS core domain-containing protein n=1 Tax=Kribbella sp. NBC_00889 TaxID=2975974 RepID=UPI00386A96EA|nr:DUF4157 domain-containing protein [Kribbella sp. NBC_00889]